MEYCKELGIVSVSDFLKWVESHSDANYKKTRVCNLFNKKVELKPKSLRYQTFLKHGTTCAFCNRKGTVMMLTPNVGKQDVETYHANLYSENEDGTYTLMTKDHILPVSIGGIDHVDNLRPMCAPCNFQRGSKLSKADFRLLKIRGFVFTKRERKMLKLYSDLADIKRRIHLNTIMQRK